MTVFPLLSGKLAVKAFRRIGYAVDHQTGSHIILRHIDPPHRRLTIPNHREIAKGTLRNILRDAGLTVDEFKDLL
ncbi:MAG: type II toxin-antitoxin system HicA family toxin [Candidatus Edwardsbacteria bacterium]|nr:type II toxin-antitoxin system HicA family toxin [Candidatus Edwardsbacteria bacterium]